MRRVIVVLVLLAPALLALRSLPGAGRPVALAFPASSLAEEEKRREGEPQEAKPDAAAEDGAKEGAKDKVRTIAIVGGTVYPVSAPPIHRGTLILQGEKILAVGPELPVPDGAEIVDATGRHVTPGFVAIGASSIGVSGRGPDMAASLDPYDFNLRMALAHGITTADVAGGSSFFFRGGRGPASSNPSIVIKLTHGDLRSMLLRETGLNSFSIPSRQIELNLFNIREGFRKAAEHLAAVAEAKEKKATPPRPATQIAPYVTILENEQPTVVTASTVEEIRDIMALRDAFSFDLVIAEPMAGAALARELATRRIPVILALRVSDFDFDLSTPEIDKEGLIPIRLPAVFRDAGCDVAIRTQTTSVSLMGLAGRDLTALAMEAAYAVRGGLSEGDALAAITLRPAAILGLADRIGSLEAGKDADVLILNRNPLDYRAFVLKTYINGKLYYEREKSRLLRDVPLR